MEKEERGRENEIERKKEWKNEFGRENNRKIGNEGKTERKEE